MKYAQVVDGKVYGTSPEQDADNPIPCNDAVRIGWLYDGSVFTEVDITPIAADPLAAAKAARIALAQTEAGTKIVGVSLGLDPSQPQLTPDELTAGINAIRAGYAAAVAAINALTDEASIQAFTW